MPRIRLTITESTLSDQKPPAPTGWLKNVRWWEMYSAGVRLVVCSAAIVSVRSLFPARAGCLVFVLVAHGNRRRENQHRDHEASEERRGHDGTVERERQPEQQH